MVETFEKADSGAAATEKVSAGGLKKGSLVMIKDKPCKVVDFSTAKVGKHGSAKAMVTGIDIFTSNKLETTFSTGDMVDAPLVKRTEYQLVNVDDDGFLSLMDDKGNMKEDVQLPTDEWLKEEVDRLKAIFEEGKKECIVTVLSALGEEKVVQAREGKDQ